MVCRPGAGRDPGLFRIPPPWREMTRCFFVPWASCPCARAGRPCHGYGWIPGQVENDNHGGLSTSRPGQYPEYGTPLAQKTSGRKISRPPSRRSTTACKSPLIAAFIDLSTRPAMATTRARRTRRRVYKEHTPANSQIFPNILIICRKKSYATRPIGWTGLPSGRCAINRRQGSGGKRTAHRRWPQSIRN